MGKIRHGGIGIIEDGNLKGREFIIPSEVLVEKGKTMGGINYAKACLIHHKFVPDQGCDTCALEIIKEEAEAKAIGL